MRLFIVAAIVLVVFAIIAAASSSGMLFSTLAIIWFFAAFLSYLVDFVFPVTFGSGGVTVVRQAPPA
jgi:hypothetical protein